MESGSPTTAKKTRYKKQVEVEIDFTSFLDKDMPDIFAPPKNPKSLLLPANRAPCNIRLPEDCHYQPESLVKLFLLPNVMVMVFTSGGYLICSLTLPNHANDIYFSCCSALARNRKNGQV